MQEAQPRQLAFVELAVDLAAVGHVHAGHPDATTGGGNEPGVALIGIDDPVVEPRRHVVDAHPREDCHTVPSTGPVVHRLVAERAERELGERVVAELRLLQAHDIGTGVGQPLLDAWQSGLQ